MEHIAANILLAGLAPAERTGEQAITLVTTDSRAVVPGCVFVAFPGEHFDGHKFAAKALEDGAAWVVLNHPVEGVPEEKTILCPDSYQAMMQMGANYRAQFSPKVVGVTGSVGKTTTKEFCATALQALARPSKPRATRTMSWACPGPCSRSTPPPVCGDRDGMNHAGEISRSVPLRQARHRHHHLHRHVPHRQPGQPGEHLQGQTGL